MSDFIKRKDAIMALRLEYPMMPMFKSLREEWAIKTEGYRKAEEVIMRLPSARQQGDWISEGRVYPPTNGYHGAVCSICGTESEYLTNFCGECGADMRKESE